MTHIHFPDSNRSNPTEKSNQVSLCGSLEGVEKARASVRVNAIIVSIHTFPFAVFRFSSKRSHFTFIFQYSTPLIISFELPIMMPGHAVPDNDTQYVKDVESKCNIQVRPHWPLTQYNNFPTPEFVFSQVIFSSRSKLHSSLVLVKGCEREANKVQEATRLLIHYMCRSMAVSVR